MATRQDLALSAGLLLALAVSTPLFAALEPGPPLPLPLLVVWALALTLPLAVRRRWPSAVAAVVAVTYVLGEVAGLTEELMSQAALMVALYSAGAHDRDRRRAGLVRAAVALLVVAWLAVELLQERDAGAGDDYAVVAVLSVLSNALALSAAMALGELAWLAQQRQQALEASSAALRAERDRVAAQAVDLERMAIARELHDVVAHHVSVMGVQAAVARRLLHRAPQQAEAALGEVEDAARGAVAELGGLVLALRSDATGEPAGPEASTSASTLGLDQVPALVEAARRAGTDVVLHCRGDLRAPTPVVGYAVYRLVQEALTNVRKHAGGGARAQVGIVVEGGAVEVQVVDDGGARGPSGDAAPAAGGAGGATGLGLVGMRERVAAAGGRLSVTRSSDGYTVSAVLPAPRGAR